MGVDGIGKGGGQPVGGVGSTPGAKEVGRSGDEFTVKEAGSAGAASPVEAAEPHALLEQLEQGRIDVDGYLDARVSEAVEPLKGSLPPDELDFVRQALREQLSTDPVLLELVRRATGQSAE